MSREIKFRVWNKITEQWSKNFNVVLLELDVLENIIINLYTGLKDSEGYEIYEDDIVWNEYDEEYQVVFLDEGEYKLMGESHIQNLYNNLYYIDVRGNVYENFELVKEWYKD
jgi:ORF029